MNRLPKIKEYLALKKFWVECGHLQQERLKIEKFERENQWIIGFDITTFLIHEVQMKEQRIAYLEGQLQQLHAGPTTYAEGEPEGAV